MLTTLSAKAPDHTTALSRLGQVRSFITEVVTTAFQRLLADSSSRTPSVSSIATQALSDTFAVFESYLG